MKQLETDINLTQSSPHQHLVGVGIFFAQARTSFNLLPLVVRNYQYDAFGRLIYEFNGDRNSSISNHTNTKAYLIERGLRSVIVENDGTNTLVYHMLADPTSNSMLAESVTGYGNNTGPVTNWILTDHQGTIAVAFSDASSNPQFLKYDSFGQIRNLDELVGYAPFIQHLSAGRGYDEHTGLYYNRARWYDPSLGRFISADPIGLAGGDTNLYRYAGNSPLNATDPSGNEIVTAAVIGIGAAIAYGSGLYASYQANEMDIASGGNGGGTFGLWRKTDQGLVRRFNQQAYSRASFRFGLGMAGVGIGVGIIAAPAFGAGIGGMVADGVIFGAIDGGVMSYAGGGRPRDWARGAAYGAAFGAVAGPVIGVAGGAALNRVAASRFGQATGRFFNRFRRQVRPLNRTSQGIGQPLDSIQEIAISYKDLSSGAARLVNGLKKKRRIVVENGYQNVAKSRIKSGAGVKIEDLRQASIYLNRELGVARDRLGNLVVVRGKGKTVSFRGSDHVLVHTHPVLESVPSHFRYDIEVADDFVEAVIDWGGNITHFNKNGVLEEWAESPINSFGYIYR